MATDTAADADADQSMWSNCPVITFQTFDDLTGKQTADRPALQLLLELAFVTNITDYSMLLPITYLDTSILRYVFHLLLHR